MGEEEKKAVEEKKAAEEEKKKEEVAAEEEVKKRENKGEEQTPPPPPPQEIVLRVFMHCEGCARKVRRCLKGFEGVEDVTTDCKTSKVVVKGEKADPVKVFERVQRKSHRQVQLISPIPSPPQPPEEPVKPPEKEEPKPQEKKVEPPVITVVLGVFMHCDACAQEIRKRILRMKGVESAEADLKNSQVTVKGVIEPQTLADHVYRKTGKHASIVKVVEPEEEKKKEDEKPKEEKNADEKTEAAPPKEGGEAAEEVVVELKRNEMYYYYPQNYYQQQRFGQEMNVAPHMFSDENPNACVVM